MITNVVMTALIFLVLYSLVRSSEKPLDSHMLQRVQVNEKKTSYK